MPGKSDITGKERPPDAESQIALGEITRSVVLRRPAFWPRAAQEIVVRAAISCVLHGEKLSDLGGWGEEGGIFSVVG